MNVVKNVMLSTLMVGCTSSVALGMEKKNDSKDIDEVQSLLIDYKFKLDLFKHAVDVGYIESVRELLATVPEEQRSAFIRSSDSKRNTALHWAAASGHIEIARLLIDALPEEQKCSFVMSTDSAGCTALHIIAAFNGRLDIAQMLIDIVPADQRSSFVMIEVEGVPAAQLARLGGFVELADMLERVAEMFENYGTTGCECSIQ